MNQPACRPKKTGDHKTIATIVAAPAEDQHRSRKESGKSGADDFGGGTAGILHQDNTADAGLGDGPPVEFLHGCGRQDFHDVSSITVATA